MVNVEIDPGSGFCGGVIRAISSVMTAVSPFPSSRINSGSAGS